MNYPQIGDISLNKYLTMTARISRFVAWAKNREETVTIVIRNTMPETFRKLFRNTGAEQVVQAMFDGTARLHTQWLVFVEISPILDLNELRAIKCCNKEGTLYPEIWEF